MEWIFEDPGSVATWTLEKLAIELVVEAVVPGAELRDEIARRFRYYAARHGPPSERKRGAVPV
jgi:Uma2 family endonuclease